MPGYRPALQRLFNTCFCAAIALPLVLCFLPHSRVSWSERRYLADAPKWPTAGELLTTFPKEFDRFFGDHFGFRDLLLSVHYRLISGPLSALIQHDALVGKDGWLFWGNEEALVDIRGDRPPLSTAMLDNWMLSLELKKAWLNRRGIPFLLVIAPDKPSIYPEQLPDGIRAPIPTTGLDLLNRYLADKGVDWVLDLKPILLRRKQSAGGRLLYYPADSHWNYLGAYYAFEAILEKLRSMGVRTPPARIRENELIPSMDDRPAEFLANAPLTLVPRVPGFRLASPAPDCIEASTIPAASLPVPSPDAFATNCRLGRGKVVVIGDSFVERLRPFLSSTFARVAFVPVGDQLMDSRPLIEAEHPDLVIYEVVERRLRLDSELWAWVVKP